MKKVTFTDYLEANVESLKGYTVVEAGNCINADETGFMMELERKIDNVTLGIDVVYDPEHEDNETPLMISDEYVKRIDEV